MRQDQFLRHNFAFFLLPWQKQPDGSSASTSLSRKPFSHEASTLSGSPATQRAEGTKGRQFLLSFHSQLLTAFFWSSKRKPRSRCSSPPSISPQLSASPRRRDLLVTSQVRQLRANSERHLPELPWEKLQKHLATTAK